MDEDYLERKEESNCKVEEKDNDASNSDDDAVLGNKNENEQASDFNLAQESNEQTPKNTQGIINYPVPQGNLLHDTFINNMIT